MGTRNKDSPNDKISASDLFPDGHSIGNERGNMALGNVVEISQPFRVNIKNADAGANPQSNFTGIGAHHSRSKDNHLSRRKRRSPTEENPPSPMPRL